jgi:hypothetical protein
MRLLKTLTTATVLITIGFFGWKGYDKFKQRPEIDPPQNQFTKEVEMEIDSLRKMPLNSFCMGYYTKVEANINEFHKDGALGLTSYKVGNFWREKVDSTRNNQWKNILMKNLYSAYVLKFIDQAMYVFERSEWNTKDIQLIRSEVKRLSASAYLDPTGPIANSFKDINLILSKYDEINNYINTCRAFTYVDYAINSNFPDLSAKLSKSKGYINNGLGNSYVNNCLRLKEDLKRVPVILFEKHIDYLRGKINQNGRRYREITFQPEYAKYIYLPLRTQLDNLSNSYGVSDTYFKQRYTELDMLLKSYNRQSLDHFNSLLIKKINN